MPSVVDTPPPAPAAASSPAASEGEIPPSPFVRLLGDREGPSWRRDLPASVVVFLVALPLCLGIAVASGAPASAGLVAGIVGGLLVGLLSGSHLMVSGPAAGLTAIVLDAIKRTGFPAFLADSAPCSPPPTGGRSSRWTCGAWRRPSRWSRRWRRCCRSRRRIGWTPRSGGPPRAAN